MCSTLTLTVYMLGGNTSWEFSHLAWPNAWLLNGPPWPPPPASCNQRSIFVSKEGDYFRYRGMAPTDKIPELCVQWVKNCKHTFSGEEKLLHLLKIPRRSAQGRSVPAETKFVASKENEQQQKQKSVQFNQAFKFWRRCCLHSGAF